MGTRSSAVDAYIAKSAPFARPILEKLRSLFHKACPEVEETIKWGFPHFEHRGVLGSMAAFKQHASFGFWKGSLMSDPRGLFRGIGKTTMAALKVQTLADLPPDKVLLAYIKEAVKLNEEGVKSPRPKKKVVKKKPVQAPDYFLAALRKQPKALAAFEAFSPSHKREYVEWITEAKQDATRQRRMETAVEWIAEGKPRNWKYMKK
jgi:uncharacterized protein YdeI (YjbR/CyaY-like superfamily)